VGWCVGGDALKQFNLNIRVFRKVGKTQHQNPKFGPNPDEIKKTQPKNTLGFMLIDFAIKICAKYYYQLLFLVPKYIYVYIFLKIRFWR
jgi:hypothetical protein